MTSTAAERFERDPVDGPAVRGFLHRPSTANGDGLVLTHGAGADCRTNLLVALAEHFCNEGFQVLRCDLPFRQERPGGPPHPSKAPTDREGLRMAVRSLRELVKGRVFLSGHSYGGRQATMLAAEGKSDRPDGLALFSYPLHPPGAPEKLRTEHLPKLDIASLFIHGTKDPFGTPEEMDSALKLIPGKRRMVLMEGADHGLLQSKASAKRTQEFVGRVLDEFRSFFG